MKRFLRRFGPAWRVQRQRHPRAAARLETAALAARGALPDQVRLLRARVAELERDHLLLAAHVATLTEQVGAGARVGPVEAEAARQRARLAAVAFYEERIGRLEDTVGRRGHARTGALRPSGRRTSGEQQSSGAQQGTAS
jgi:hypothetical protein